MKKLMGIVATFFIILTSNAYCEDNQQKAISLFEKKVALFEEFYGKSPVILEKQSYSESPTGYIFFYNKYELINIAYDIRKTDSLVSPYSAYIDVNYSFEESMKCGDVSGSEDKYFSTLDIARKNGNNNICYKPSSISPETVRFYFAFQKGKWVFKKVLSAEKGYPRPGISTALGRPMQGRFPVEDNDHWKQLIQ